MKITDFTPNESQIRVCEKFFPPEAIKQLATKYELEFERLSKALCLAALDYDEDSEIGLCIPHIATMESKAQTSFDALHKVQNQWKNASKEVKHTAEVYSGGCSVDKMLIQINNAVWFMDQIRSIIKNRPRGATPKLQMFGRAVDWLDRLWTSEKGEPIRPKVKRNPSSSKKGKSKSDVTVGSQGLAFLHECINHLHRGVSVSTCETLIKYLQEYKASGYWDDTIG